MKPDDLDRWLVDDDAIVPSSGFTASVMEAVEREASMPPAIPFPWTRALPGLAALVVALLAAVGGVTLFGVWPSNDALLPMVDQVTSMGGQLHWIAAAVMLTLASLAWSWRLTRG
jgi:hypothetical protein